MEIRPDTLGNMLQGGNRKMTRKNRIGINQEIKVILVSDALLFSRSVPFAKETGPRFD